MSGLAVEQVALLLESSCALIESELKALGDAEATWHPAAGEWCVKECLGHIIESEKRGFAGRIRQLLEHDRPACVSWDQVAVARERRDCERMADSLWMEFIGLRHASVALVRALRTDQLDRTGMHPQVGEVSIRDLLHEWVHHDRNHTKQMLSVVQERVWPAMGNARKFSLPH